MALFSIDFQLIGFQLIESVEAMEPYGLLISDPSTQRILIDRQISTNYFTSSATRPAMLGCALSRGVGVSTMM